MMFSSEMLRCSGLRHFVDPSVQLNLIPLHTLWLYSTLLPPLLLTDKSHTVTLQLLEGFSLQYKNTVCHSEAFTETTDGVVLLGRTVSI